MITIIPAIDIIEGKCVRLSKGAYDTKKIYNEDPAAVAKQFTDAGFTRLHLVDLDGAVQGKVQNWKVLEAITASTTLEVDFSGGIASVEEVHTAFNSGARYVSIGSVAVKRKDLLVEWLTDFGADRFLLGADVNNEMIAVKGWTENTQVSVYDLITTYRGHGIEQVFCTDISKDGMMQGPSLELYRSILQQFPGLQLIASGGVSSVSDVQALDGIGCSGVIIGKAFYEGLIQPKELEAYVN